jgi:hypothetical protein
MRAKRFCFCLLAIVVVALVVTPVFADPLFSGTVSVGDRYAITTISGEAHAWIGGSWVATPADLQLVAEVTYAGPHNVVFRIISGTIQFNGQTYAIAATAWRGDYNRDSHTCLYQGPAVAPDGQRAFFIVYGRDTQSVQQGTYMDMWSAFRDEDRTLWRISLTTYRFKIN